MHFLSQGARQGEKVLYVSLSEPVEKIRVSAQSQGFDFTNVEVLDVSPSADFLAEMRTYDIFSVAEQEREPLMRKISDAIERVKPTRVFIDPITQLRFLATDVFQFRRQVLSFLLFFAQRGATLLCSSESTDTEADDYLQIVADGVISLDWTLEEGRTLSVFKFRGGDFESGRHSMRLTGEGMKVFPKLVPEEHGVPFTQEALASGIPDLDEMLHGGLERGTITILTGPAGVGKTTIGLQFMKEAAGRGEHSVVYSFEEETAIMLQRSQSLGIPAKTMIERGTLSLLRVEPLGLSPDEFAAQVRQEVEQKKATIVMIDSIAGYRLTLKGADLVTNMHALCKYLQNMGVAVLLINETEEISGMFRVTDFKISYLADNVIFMRYMEQHHAGGIQLRKVLGVLKKRSSDFDRSIRELEFTRYGLRVSKPLRNVNSILSTMPIWTPDEDSL